MAINVGDRKEKLKQRYVNLASEYDHDRYGSETGNFYLEQTDQILFDLISDLGFKDLNKIKILDVATGTGRNLASLQEHGATHILGLDYVANMLAQAKSKNASIANRLVQGDAEKLPIKDESFDLVISSRFFHLIPRVMQQQALKEFARILKPNGFIIIEHVNPLYFLNLKTLAKTIVKFFIQKETRAITTWPFFWSLKYPFLKPAKIYGTWILNEAETIQFLQPLAKKINSWSKIPGLNRLSERLLISFRKK